MAACILIAEANAALAEALRTNLTDAGFSAETVSTGTDALRLLDAPCFDAVLLDRALPDMDGISVLREMRTRALDTPVMLLSTRTSVAERVFGLDSGADDYLIRPFHMEECMARVRRLVRTYQRRTAGGRIAGGLHCIADLTVDSAHHVATSCAFREGMRNSGISGAAPGYADDACRDRRICVRRARGRQ